MNEVDQIKARFAKAIEDGRKVEVFTSMPEYQWFSEHVIKPTITEYTERIIRGDIPDEKQEWIIRGMIQGLRLAIFEAPEGMIRHADSQEQAAKKLQEGIDATS